MKHRYTSLLTSALLAFASASAPAQGLRAGSLATPVQAPAPIRQADYIVAVVNQEPITNSEVQQEVRRAQQQAGLPGVNLPDAKTLAAQVLDSLIGRKAQLQLAKEIGVRIDIPSIDQAEQSVAQQNQMSLVQLHQRVEQEGMTVAKFREQLREQLTLQRLREREVEPRVQVSDLEVDQYIQAQQTPEAMAKQAINLAQILVAVPESASAAQVATLQARALLALKRARAGENFGQLVKLFGDPSTQANGAAMGLRDPDRYPTLFVQAALAIQPGQVTDVVRSPAGFHVLKLLERVNPNMPATVVKQSLARHILLRPSFQMREALAVARLLDFKRRIAGGQATFAGLAREFSQDSSSAQGGDLGWASPGMFVPEFEEAMTRLSPGEISDPFISRFGVHLIELLERREQARSDAQIQESVRGVLRNQKLEEAYQVWARDLRDRAYVDIRQAPQ